MCTNDSDIYAAIQSIADLHFGGHFTIMKFTTNWRVSFGHQPNHREDIDAMACGPDLESAYILATSEAMYRRAAHISQGYTHQQRQELTRQFQDVLTRCNDLEFGQAILAATRELRQAPGRRD